MTTYTQIQYRSHVNIPEVTHELPDDIRYACIISNLL